MVSTSQKREPLLNVMISGGIGGGLADAIMHSVDTVKTRLQGQAALKGRKYFGITQSFRVIVAEEGLRGLYGGFSAAVMGGLACTTVYFGTYETMKRTLTDAGANPYLSYFISGGMADVFGSFVYVPSEVLKTRLQLQGRYNNPHSLSAHNYKHTYDALSTIYQKRGLAGLYHGWGATLLRDVPFTAIQFTIYETCKNWITATFCGGDRSKLNTIHDLISGASAGVIAGAVTTPLDVVKTYLQTQKRPIRPATYVTAPEVIADIPLKSAKSNVKLTAPFYPNVSSALVGIYGQNGVRGLFAGIAPRMIWTGLQSMLMFVFYENGLEFVSKYME